MFIFLTPSSGFVSHWLYSQSEVTFLSRWSFPHRPLCLGVLGTTHIMGSSFLGLGTGDSSGITSPV